MRNPKLLSVAFLAMLFTFSLKAQEGKAVVEFNTGADVFSNYVWRGSKFGQGPSIQPSVSFSYGVFTLGTWGAFDASGYAETDPYLSFSFPFGLSLGLTDYYYPGLDLFDLTNETGSQAFELNTGFNKAGLGLSFNYILNEAGSAGSQGGDLYVQAGYDFEKFSLFAGAGNGWHTSDTEFDFCNIGVGTTKDIRITENLSVPVKGQVIFNPDKSQLYVVAGFSF
jgi:hypothetical protein